MTTISHLWSAITEGLISNADSLWNSMEYIHTMFTIFTKVVADFRLHLWLGIRSVTVQI